MPTKVSPSEVASLKHKIFEFIAKRKQVKLDKLRSDQYDERVQLEYDYQPVVWLAEAVKRSGQIQLATHTLKPIHPDAKGSNLYVPNLKGREDEVVGSHCLLMVDDDVVGNAAALDVFKLLKLTHDGVSLLQRVLDNDPNMRAALNDDLELAQSWMDALATVAHGKNEPTSHALAKQLYWPISDGQYHLLAPLFSSSLVNAVWCRFREDYYSESAGMARRAWRAREPSPIGFREYPNVLIQKFGGTKPQNISQLNSERHGENWLLPSLPPIWQSTTVRLPYRIGTVFGRWLRERRPIRELTDELRDYIASLRYDQNNYALRERRADLIQQIVSEVLLFASELHDLPSGWSTHSDCHLSEQEACWLDPYRAETDEEFRTAYTMRPWRTEVAHRFGVWLNHAIELEGTPMAESEHFEWKRILDRELRLLRDVI